MNRVKSTLGGVSKSGVRLTFKTAPYLFFAKMPKMTKWGVMKVARPRKVVDISTGKIGKEKIKNRQEQEENIKLQRDNLERGAPKWLDEIAAEEYNRVVEEAGKIELLDNLDLSMLAVYADNYSRYQKSAEKIRDMGMTIETEKGGEIISPYVVIADKAATQIQKCSAKLGLATTDRLKLIVPTKEPQKRNKFLDCL